MFIVNCLMFRLCGEKRRSFQLKLLPLLFVKGKWHIHKLPTIFGLCMFDIFSLCMCRCYQYCYAETVWSSTPILAGLESYNNLVDMLSYAKIKCFSETRLQIYSRLRTTWSHLTKKTTWSNRIMNGRRSSTCQCGKCRQQTCRYA